MGKASDQFRQSDVTMWGLVALACAGFAVLSTNLSAVLPENVLSGLHAPRQAGASLSSLRAQVNSLMQEQVRLRRENAELVNRFALSEKASGEVTQRVGALEVSMPTLLEAIPPGTEVDRSAVTASIGAPDESAGDAVVSMQPLPEARPEQQIQSLPALVTGAPTETSTETVAEEVEVVLEPLPFAVALGTSVAKDAASASWDDMQARVGPLLLGLKPLFVAPEGSEMGTIVAGPLTGLERAAELCARLEAVNIACLPVPYGGIPLVTQ